MHLYVLGVSCRICRPQGELTDISEGAAAGLRGMYIRDPHGIIVELVELT
jgi:hypothetical protein